MVIIAIEKEKVGKPMLQVTLAGNAKETLGELYRTYCVNCEKPIDRRDGDKRGNYCFDCTE